MTNKIKFNIKYHNENMPKLELIGEDKSNWIDLRVNTVKVISTNGNVSEYTDFETVSYKMGDTVFVDFGVSIDMTDIETGKEYVANVYPRSSTFKNYGLFLSNSVGCIDHSYRGNNDTWKGMFIAMRDGQLCKFDRVAQFEVCEKSPLIQFVETDDLGNDGRGGYGSTGTK